MWMFSRSTESDSTRITLKHNPQFYLHLPHTSQGYGPGFTHSPVRPEQRLTPSTIYVLVNRSTRILGPKAKSRTFDNIWLVGSTIVLKDVSGVLGAADALIGKAVDRMQTRCFYRHKNDSRTDPLPPTKGWKGMLRTASKYDHVDWLIRPATSSVQLSPGWVPCNPPIASRPGSPQIGLTASESSAADLTPLDAAPSTGFAVPRAPSRLRAVPGNNSSTSIHSLDASHPDATFSDPHHWTRVASPLPLTTQANRREENTLQTTRKKGRDPSKAPADLQQGYVELRGGNDHGLISRDDGRTRSTNNPADGHPDTRSRRSMALRSNLLTSNVQGAAQEQSRPTLVRPVPANEGTQNQRTNVLAQDTLLPSAGDSLAVPASVRSHNVADDSVSHTSIADPPRPSSEPPLRRHPSGGRPVPLPEPLKSSRSRFRYQYPGPANHQRVTAGPNGQGPELDSHLARHIVD